MLHVVTGAPCAGKTTYIQTHKNDGDIVIDLDTIATSLGAGDNHEYSDSIRKVALAARKAAIDAVGDCDAWIIHTKPTKEQRESYAGAVFHDLDPGKEECIKRAHLDNRPEWTVGAISKWYGESEPNGSFSIGRADKARQLSEGGEKLPFFMPEKGGRSSAMTENIDQAANDNATEVDETPTDWQAKYEAMRAHSREWEAKAKANKAAADELEQIKAAQMTEQEKLTARAEAAEAKLAELEARQAHDEAAKQIAKDTGVPFELLSYCSDENAMREFAGKYAENKPSPAPAAAAARIIRTDGKRTSADVFADFIKESF